MLDKKDYSKLTLEELLIEENKIKKNEIISAVLIGVLLGVMLYGIAKNGIGFIYIFIPLLLMSGIYKNSQNQKQNLKEVEESINAKKTTKKQQIKNELNASKKST